MPSPHRVEGEDGGGAVEGQDRADGDGQCAPRHGVAGGVVEAGGDEGQAEGALGGGGGHGHGVGAPAGQGGDDRDEARGGGGCR